MREIVFVYDTRKRESQWQVEYAHDLGNLRWISRDYAQQTIRNQVKRGRPEPEYSVEWVGIRVKPTGKSVLDPHRVVRFKGFKGTYYVKEHYVKHLMKRVA